MTPVVATLDGGHWTESSLRAVLGSSADPKATVEGAAVGPLGVAVAIGGASSTDVLFSQDGTTWSVQPLSQFVSAASLQVTSVVVTANRAVVTHELPDSKNTGPAPSVVVVGTPACSCSRAGEASASRQSYVMIRENRILEVGGSSCLPWWRFAVL